MRGLVTFFFLFLITQTPASAQDTVQKLTENNIRTFIENITRMTNAAKSGRRQEQLTSFLENHLHPDAYFRSTMQYAMPGFPAQKNSMSFDRRQYIESVTTGQEHVRDYTADVRVENVRISSDKTKATVQTLTRESGVMNVRAQNIEEEVPMSGNSTCQQIIMLSGDKVMQLYSANCTTQLHFEQSLP